jgi:DNA segregation ATPase FtsK/SpoIIIE-like protein
MKSGAPQLWELAMKILKTLVVIALALGAALVRADPPSQVGRLNFISGPVSFAPADAADDWALATLNRPITTGDRLWADNGGRAEMHVGSTAVRLTEMTSVDVLNVDDRNIQLRLAEGSVNVHVRYLDRDDTFEVDTPHGAVILNQPGSYRISVDPSGIETMVGVRSGQADVLTPDSRFTVQGNEQARITGTQTPGYDIAAMPPMDEFDRWAAARDRREDRIAATRYVPREMTGYEDLDEYGAWRDMPEYGSVWVPAEVPVGWAPYRYGHWVWISPWGWTWVDSMPWGFAPYHYGRWLWLGSYWAWAPGPVAVRPVYAPALVAFVGGSNFSVSIGIGSAPAVAWVPLGWREPYIPWYRVSPAYVRNVNIAHVKNINVTNLYNITNQNTTVTNINYANRRAPSGVTVVRRDAFVSAKPVEQLTVSSQTLSAAPVTSAAPVRTPERASFAASRSGPKPPAAATAREVVAAKAPPIPVRDERANVPKGDRGLASAQPNGERPRVRVINRQQRVELQATEAQRGSAPATQAQPGQQAERQERRGQASRGQVSNTPQAPSAPQPETRATPRPAPEQRTEQQHQQRQQQAQEQQAREQQARQREMQQREEERQKAQQQRAQQQAQEQQAREQRAQQQRAQQQAQEQQAREQRVQQQRAQQQAQEQQARQREMQQQVERQKAQQQQHAQQAQRQQDLQQQQEQRLRENAEKRAPQASLAAERRPQPQQRAEQAREKGRDRQGAEKSD